MPYERDKTYEDTIAMLTAERDELKVQVKFASARADDNEAAVKRLEADNERLAQQLTQALVRAKDNERLKAEFKDAHMSTLKAFAREFADPSLLAENDRLRAELKCHAASEQGSVVANRKPGSPKDPQAETPVEAVRRFQRDFPLDTSDPYTKLFAIAELRTAQLTELRKAFSTLADDIENRGYSVSATHIRALLNKVTPIA